MKLDCSIVSRLKKKGFIRFDQGYHLVEVDNLYIEKMFKQVEGKEGYHRPKYCAHISVIYPDELVEGDQAKIQEVSFSIGAYQAFAMNGKQYLALIVESLDLEKYRLAYGLSQHPTFRGVKVPFHSTFAKGIINPT